MDTDTTIINPDWLNSSDSSINFLTSWVCSNCNCTPCCCWNRPSYTYWTSSDPVKVTLTLTEVEHLRKLARRDSKLRKTLKKFTPYIQVEVDFPGD